MKAYRKERIVIYTGIKLLQYISRTCVQKPYSTQKLEIMSYSARVQ